MEVTEKEKQQQQQQPQQQLANIALPYCGFSPARRNFIIAMVSMAGFLGPLAGGIYLPALPVLSQEFGVSSTAINATVSVFMAFCALSPLVWASFADWGGRRPLYISALAIYIAANILMATLPANFGALIFLRMVQAFGCSAAISLGAGSVADVTEPARRGSAMAIFLLGPNLGPTLGPVLGGVITGQTSWRWTFGVLAITVGVVWIIIIFALPETLRSRVGNGSLYAKSGPLLWPPHLSSPLAPESERGPPPPKPSAKNIWRLFCNPPISISSFYTAILFANYFSMAVDLPVVLTNQYGWSVTAVGGGYLALGIAIIVGSMTGGRYSDWRRARAVKASTDGLVAPENRLVDQIWGTLVCAAGSVLYGWFVDRNIHPAAVLVATALTGFGMSSVLVVTFAFVTEIVPKAAAGAMAVENLMRNPAAAVAAVVAPPLLARMGTGWYFTGFALVDVSVFGSGALFLAVHSSRLKAKLATKATESSGISSPADVEKVAEP